MANLFLHTVCYQMRRWPLVKAPHLITSTSQWTVINKPSLIVDQAATSLGIN